MEEERTGGATGLTEGSSAVCRIDAQQSDASGVLNLQRERAVCGVLECGCTGCAIE